MGPCLCSPDKGYCISCAVWRGSQRPEWEAKHIPARDPAKEGACCACCCLQIIILAILPAITGSWESAGDVNIKVAVVLLALLTQAVPRIFRLFHQFKGAAAISGSLFESAWATFLLNLSYYLMVSHIVGAVWYLFCVEVCHS